MAWRDQHLGKVAAAEPLLAIDPPEPPAEPLVLAEPPAELPLPIPVELLPLRPELEPEPAAADFNFGWPVAWSRQWVAAEIEPEPAPDGLLPDWAAAARTLPPRKTDASNKVFRFIACSFW